MRLLLDTNVVIALLNGRPEGVRICFEEASRQGSTFYFSSVVDFELRYGIAKSQQRLKSEAKLASLLKFPFVPLSFDSAQAAVAGEVRASLERQGCPIGAYDVQIAGQALYHGLTLVTANRDEFARVAGLQVIDWSA